MPAPAAEPEPAQIRPETPARAVAPHSGVIAPATHDRLPRATVDGQAACWLIGCHGGAGTTTLAQLLQLPELSRAWPTRADGRMLRTVLVARTNDAGLRAVQTAATQWAAGLLPDVDVLGVVFVTDAPGRLPKPLRKRVRLVGSVLPQSWQLPWVPAWRESPATETSIPAAVRTVLERITQSINNPAVPSL
ncbi:DUF6668 family protein [Plantibacter sp. CFBP 13570]|uniref:DUF6668 family protein n=1 Tax=Plantibacter sp. CFBP 13570 TaxID=2775272 RepID=UPI001930A0D6|nr:DUF6668 family protein [Plantibacter sp. CFBP 13570]MBD8535649.1 hypothetical protein [Plantibacter sp. CFBP 13570]